MPETKGPQPSSNPPHPDPGPRPAERTHKHWGWIVALCVVLALGAVLWLRYRPATAAKGKKAPGAPPPVQVETATVHTGDVGVYVNAIGAVTPIYTVSVKSRVDGQLMSVNYVEGQMVHAGDSLVEIDARPFQAQLTQAEGQLARDKALLENAKVDLDRYRTALSKNAIPKQQYDTQVATVHQYEGAVEFDQGTVDTAKLQIVYSHITAPISGRVGLRLVDPGNIVHATDTNPLAVITQLQPITVLFSVAEDYLPEIQQQLALGKQLKVDAYDRAQQHLLAAGTLLALDNQIDQTTGTVRLKGVFTNEDNALFPNQFVNARLLVTTEHGATLVPTAAIQRNAQEAFVYVVQTNQTVAMQPITVGTSDGTVTAVQGVKPGEVIAANNFNRLQEGSRVTTGQARRGKLTAEK